MKNCPAGRGDKVGGAIPPRVQGDQATEADIGPARPSRAKRDRVGRGAAQYFTGLCLRTSLDESIVETYGWFSKDEDRPRH